MDCHIWRRSQVLHGKLELQSPRLVVEVGSLRQRVALKLQQQYLKLLPARFLKIAVRDVHRPLQ